MITFVFPAYIFSMLYVVHDMVFCLRITWVISQRKNEERGVPRHM